MSNHSRQPAGVPTGGQFAASQHTEADVSLRSATPEAEAAHKKFEAAVDALRDAQNALYVAGAETAAATVRGYFPDATKVGFHSEEAGGGCNVGLAYVISEEAGYTDIEAAGMSTEDVEHVGTAFAHMLEAGELSFEAEYEFDLEGSVIDWPELPKRAGATEQVDGA